MAVASPAVREFAGNGTRWVRARLGGVQTQSAVGEDAVAVPKPDSSAKKEA